MEGFLLVFVVFYLLLKLYGTYLVDAEKRKDKQNIEALEKAERAQPLSTREKQLIAIYFGYRFVSKRVFIIDGQFSDDAKEVDTGQRQVILSHFAGVKVQMTPTATQYLPAAKMPLGSRQTESRAFVQIEAIQVVDYLIVIAIGDAYSLVKEEAGTLSEMQTTREVAWSQILDSDPRVAAQQTSTTNKTQDR
uniref:hypothetical protein n=1 Tax=Thaumasiovibrio occultus TaxID=1891184 RepID=UPI000B35E07B|nr:hypothetical protein [Thaumasiovibrio occultus]